MKLLHTSKVMVKVGGLNWSIYITVLVLAALTPLCHMNQLGCGSSAIYAWPVDTSFECSKSVNSSVDHVGRWYIRFRYSFRLFNFWRHIMTLYTSTFELTITSFGSQDRQASQASFFCSWPYTL